jgi:hypothetical protein
MIRCLARNPFETRRQEAREEEGVPNVVVVDVENWKVENFVIPTPAYSRLY